MKVVSLTVCSNSAYMKSNERERMVAYICEYKGKCPMYESGKCVCQDLFIGAIKCPHSKRIQQSGLTKKARNFGKAARRWKEEYATDIKISNSTLSRCGDYIFLPYPHLDVFGTKVFDVLENDHFIPADKFDTKAIRRLVTYRPQSFMGGEIITYQSEQVPKLIQQLHDFSPDLYNQYLFEYPDSKEFFDKICENYVGRRAYLYSLKDGAVYIDCHGNKWVKDGKFLVCDSMKTTIYMTVGYKPRKVMQEITDDAIVKVMSNEDVSSETVFAE